MPINSFCGWQSGNADELERTIVMSRWIWMLFALLYLLPRLSVADE